MRDMYMKLMDVANRTKEAVISRWETTEGFTDKNKYTRQGALPEATGLCSLLLYSVAFRNENAIYNSSDKDTVSKIVESSFAKLKRWSVGGYGATPLTRKTDIFDSKNDYTDTVTWVLSASILARYAERNGAITVTPETRETIFDMMNVSFSSLMESQREDGTWGFRTDRNAKSSLYFTYSASSAVADFFDYILGEIGEVEVIGDNIRTVEPKDTEVIKYLSSALGYDVEKKATEVRAALQNWLIRYALPLLPKIASCCKMTDHERELVGMWSHNSVAFGGESKIYYHLYYAYYLIDMMVTSSVDIRMKSIINNPDELRRLEENYRADGLFNGGDLTYFFDENNRVDELFTMYIEQAIHTTRTQYISAKKTGGNFWVGTGSELPISWLHETDSISNKAKILLSQVSGVGGVSDPTVSPMALRANINYSFYVANKPDYTIEGLFDDICDEACSEIDEYNEDCCVLDLWDATNYSIPVTERAIEAIVDFYDYLCRFEEREAVEERTVTNASFARKVEKSALDIALETKFAEYLRSDVGRSVIAEISVGTTQPVAYGTERTDDLITEIERISDFINQTTLLNTHGDEDERLTAALVNLHRAISACSTKDKIRTTVKRVSYKTDADYQKRILHCANEYMRRVDELFKDLVADTDFIECDFSSLYTQLKLLISEGRK